MKDQSIWLVYDKKQVNGERALSYDDIVEEALCFGWIDSLPRKLSDTQVMLYIAKRKPKVEWSKLNKSRIQKLTKQGLMHPSGLVTVSLAKKSGAWNKIDASENHQLPDFFLTALAKDKKAKMNFETFAPSWRKALLHKLNSPKTEVTKKKKFEFVMMLCREDINAQEYRRRYIVRK